MDTRLVFTSSPTINNSTEIDTARSIEYFGVVNYATTERVLEEIRELMKEDRKAPIFLSITSGGGPSGTAMSFYDHVRDVLKPNLTTIGSGDVDSSGVILLMAGTRRLITRNTSLLLHPAGRIFEEGRRYTSLEHDAMLREDKLKDFQYASIVAENSCGRLAPETVQELMERHTILTPTDLLSYGLVEHILGT